MAPTSEDWHARHARTTAPERDSPSPTADGTGSSVEDDWHDRHGHVHRLADR